MLWPLWCPQPVPKSSPGSGRAAESTGNESGSPPHPRALQHGEAALQGRGGKAFLLQGLSAGFFSPPAARALPRLRAAVLPDALLVPVLARCHGAAVTPPSPGLVFIPNPPHSRLLLDWLIPLFCCLSSPLHPPRGLKITPGWLLQCQGCRERCNTRFPSWHMAGFKVTPGREE